MVTLYGIKNCDTVKKARQWLDKHGVEYRFHDVREDGLSKKQVADWVSELGWETLINKRSASWKQLDASDRETMSASRAVEAVIAQPTLIKRPLLDTGGERHTGFSSDRYFQLFAAHNL
ncbi:MAG: ArsC family reductase [Pseudomonadota bacterium]